MKPTRIYEAFEVRPDPNARRAELDRPEANLTQRWTPPDAESEFPIPPEDFAFSQPTRGWGINE